MKIEKSKKDIAFDKERAKYRHEINDLQRTISKQLAEISNLSKRISELEGRALGKKTNGFIDFWNIHNFQKKI